MKSLSNKFKIGFLPFLFSTFFLIPCFARDQKLKDKDNLFASIGVSKFSDEYMNQEWGNSFPLTVGTNTYLAENLRYAWSASLAFNRKTYSLDENVVSYSQYTNFLTTASL